MNPIKTLATAAVGIALLYSVTNSTAATGQDASSALRGHDANAPVDWSAERIEVQDRADRVFLTGDVRVAQGNLRLQAPRIRVAYTNVSGIGIDRIDASGGVRMHSPSETARSDFAIYDLNRKLITMVGDVVLTRNDADIRGGRLVIDLNDGRAVMDGGPAGAGTSGSDPDGPPTGRVSGRFTVPQRQSQ